MKLKVLQNYRGKFNLMSNEETHCFSMAIVDEDGKVITDENGIKARIDYNNEESLYEFDEPFEYIEQLFDVCFKDSKRWIGSTPYIKQHVLFKKVFEENFEEINKNTLSDVKAVKIKEIESLKSKLKSLKYFVEKEDEILYNSVLNSSEIDKHNALYRKWISENEQEMKDLVEGSETWKKKVEKIEGYKKQLI